MTYEDFQLVREDWNRYTLIPENIPLRIRVSLVTVKLEDDNASFDFSNFLRLSPQPDDKGKASVDPSITAQDILRNWEFKKEFESLNIYDIPKIKKLLLCRPALTSFARTSKFDSKGDRIYQSQFATAVALLDYPPEASEAVSQSRSMQERP